MDMYSLCVLQGGHQRGTQGSTKGEPFCQEASGVDKGVGKKFSSDVALNPLIKITRVLRDDDIL